MTESVSAITASLGRAHRRHPKTSGVNRAGYVNRAFVDQIDAAEDGETEARAVSQADDAEIDRHAAVIAAIIRGDGV